MKCGEQDECLKGARICYTCAYIQEERQKRMQELPRDIIAQHALKGMQSNDIPLELVLLVRLQLMSKPHLVETKCSYTKGHGIVDQILVTHQVVENVTDIDITDV